MTLLRDQELTRARAEIMDMARRGAERQADVVADAKALLTLAVSLPVSAPGAGSACFEPFKKIVDDLPWLRSLWVVGRDGRAICTNSEKPTTVNLADCAYLQRAIASRGFVLSDYLVGRLSGRPSVVVALPRVKDGTVETVVAAMIEVDWLSRIVVEIGATNGADVLLLDSAGTVVAAYPQPKSWVGQNLANLSATLKGPDGTLESESPDGDRRIVGHVRLRDTNAALAVMMPLGGVVADANRLALYEIGKILIAGLVSFLVVWLGGERLLMRPIRNLSRSASRLGSGDLDTRIATEGLSPELKRLGESFNHMATQLRERDARLRRANERLSELACKDALTGIANRRGFDRQLTAEWRRACRTGEPLALLVVDVDHFKRFNDRNGHAEGDACLKRVAESLTKISRRAGDFAARTGGDEFVLLLPGADLDDASAIAETIREDIAGMGLQYGDYPGMHVTVSVGAVAMSADRSGDMPSLVDFADAALYRAKRAGRNQVVVFDRKAVALAS